MKYYNPDEPLNTDAWLALDDEEKKTLVSKYHEHIKDEFPDASALSMHSLIHVIVENQIATNVDFVPETVTRLVRQGLPRHEAIHAISAILMEDIYGMLKGATKEFSSKKYRRKLERITPKRWRKGQY